MRKKLAPTGWKWKKVIPKFYLNLKKRKEKENYWFKNLTKIKVQTD